MMRSATALLLFAGALGAQEFDLVVANGRVMDPASNLDAVRYVGIRAGKIAAVSESPLRGKTTVDARGLVVSPGFIDLHSHGQTPENYGFKARDGVTTALEMEVGVSPVIPWYRAREGKALINFGATSGHLPARMAVMHDSGSLLPRDNAVTRAATPEEQRQIHALVAKGLDDGALGIGMGIAYIPLVTRAEILDLFRLAAQRHAVIYVHMRNGGPVEPGVVDALQEVIADAAATGASRARGPHHQHGAARDAAVPRDDRWSARAGPRYHHRSVLLHCRNDRLELRHLRRGLAAAPGRNHLP